MSRALVGVAVALGLVACKADGGAQDDGSTTTGDVDEPLEIIGLWVDDISADHDIDEDRWVQSFDPDVYTYFILYFDNTTREVMTRTPNDQTYSRFEWEWVDEQLYYCASATGHATAVEAEMVARADASDPATGGCVGAPWHTLDPA